MGISPIPGVPGAPFLMIFTDLDGTLLDYITYEWREAMPALNVCKGCEIPVILVSSKTRAEMDLLRRSMSLSDPFISENGGGIFFPRETFKAPPLEATAAPALGAQKAHGDEGLWQWSLGLPYPDLIKGLQDLREELGWHIRGFSDMSIEEISYLTGLDIERASLAAMREFDEPFVIPDQEEPNLEALSEAVVKRGLRVSSGGRFYHLQGKNDKGVAMERLISWYGGGQRKIISIVLGDSPNDFPMLERADFPVLVRSGQEYPALKEKISRLKVTRDMGPSGWNSAVLEILRGEREERANG
jgi:mannosyl-3-phosphoglycerate phosphatase